MPISLQPPDVLGRVGLSGPTVDTDSNPGRLAALLENHRAFLRYLERRVGERALAARNTPDKELETEICACVLRLAATLKPEYVEVLEAVEIGGTSVKTFAGERGLAPGNAGVRVFRARAALKRLVIKSCGVCAEHGCVNCTCRQA